MAFRAFAIVSSFLRAASSSRLAMSAFCCSRQLLRDSRVQLSGPNDYRHSPRQSPSWQTREYEERLCRRARGARPSQTHRINSDSPSSCGAGAGVEAAGGEKAAGSCVDVPFRPVSWGCKSKLRAISPRVPAHPAMQRLTCSLGISISGYSCSNAANSLVPVTETCCGT